MNEWQVLRNRYSSNRSYKNRVALSLSRYEEFENYLVDMGAEVYSQPEQNEVLRFRLNNVLGIWYTSGSGNLLMHDLADKFKEGIKA